MKQINAGIAAIGADGTCNMYDIMLLGWVFGSKDKEILLTAIECGSKGKAAAQLAMSQPGVSKALPDMEHTLGGEAVTTSRGASEVSRESNAALATGRTNCLSLEFVTYGAERNHMLLNVGSSAHLSLSVLMELRPYPSIL